MVKDIGQLKKRITELDVLLAQLGRNNDLRDLLKVIIRPGWTTPAELIFATGLVETMISQVAVMEQLKAVLIRGSRAVSNK